MMEGSGAVAGAVAGAGAGAGPVLVTTGSGCGSVRPKNWSVPGLLNSYWSVLGLPNSHWSVSDGEGSAARAGKPAGDCASPLLSSAHHAARLPLVAGPFQIIYCFLQVRS
jgi:hypothetical protein